MEKERRIPIIEVFGPTIQGEGLLLGYPTDFLRTGGCGYKCTWCDSMHAVDPAQVKQNRRMMTIGDILLELEQLPRAPWLTLTGGDPCMHDLGGLQNWCWAQGIHVCVETQGEFFPTWLNTVDVITFSPKGPSSGMNTDIIHFREALLSLRKRTAAQIVIKVVVFNEEDLKYASTLYNALRVNNGSPLYQKFYFQVGSPLTSELPDPEVIVGEDHSEPKDVIVRRLKGTLKRETILARYEWLVSELLKQVHELDYNTAITPQQHVLLWPLEEVGR